MALILPYLEDELLSDLPIGVLGLFFMNQDGRGSLAFRMGGFFSEEGKLGKARGYESRQDRCGWRRKLPR